MQTLDDIVKIMLENINKIEENIDPYYFDNSDELDEIKECCNKIVKIFDLNVKE